MKWSLTQAEISMCKWMCKTYYKDCEDTGKPKLKMKRKTRKPMIRNKKT